LFGEEGRAILRHELSHACFHLDNKYATFAQKLYDSWNPLIREIWLEYLKHSCNYAESEYTDELLAHFIENEEDVDLYSMIDAPQVHAVQRLRRMLDRLLPQTLVEDLRKKPAVKRLRKTQKIPKPQTR